MKIGPNKYKCPTCERTLPAGDMAIANGKIKSLCSRCANTASKVSHDKSARLKPEVIEANKQAAARRRIEDLRMQREIEGNDFA